ncbi:MAG: hypothetical protein KME43_16020 [Myxacorys chilensis ATA2-1-KO14]|jgi:hypothetical protein|nr:hypothetical protein [Myxacorys chilensis ATA2-1-KO14]
MRSLTAWLLNSLGLLLIVAPIPSYAATIRQNFELTVTRVTPPSTVNPSNPDLSNLPLPAIGTKGQGSFIYDESQLTLDQESIYQEYYYLGRRGSIAFSDFSLDFFNRTYTGVGSSQARGTPFFLFTRNAAGQYTPDSPYFDTSEAGVQLGATVRFIGQSFYYYPASIAVNNPSDIGSADGTLQFTEAEVVPEPPASAIAPVLALGMGWFYHRRRTARRKF